MYKFVKAEDSTCILGDNIENNFVELWKTKWDEIHNESDVLRYKIDNLQEKILDNKYLIQLNPDRGTKRRMPEPIDNVCQPFDEKQFNFTKVSNKEILFNLLKEDNATDIHSLVINVSPITRYHTLLCPSLSKCLPQVITPESLIIALDIMFLAQHRDLRIGFNSLCALASVNHLHYHLFLERHTLPVETAKCRHLRGPVFCFQDYPAPAFCFQVQTKESVKFVSIEIFVLLSYFLNSSIAHNLFITRGEKLIPGDDKKEVVRVIVWPRKSSTGVKQLDAFNVAVCELSGWIPVYDKTAYEELKTENVEREMRKWKHDNFDVLCQEVKTMF